MKGKQFPESRADGGGDEAACLGTGLSAQRGPTAAQGSAPGALLVGAGGGFPWSDRPGEEQSGLRQSLAALDVTKAPALPRMPPSPTRPQLQFSGNVEGEIGDQGPRCRDHSLQDDHRERLGRQRTEL